MLIDPAGRHAAVGRLDHHRHAAGPEGLVQRSGDLPGQPLLELKPPGISVDQPRQLGDSDDSSVRAVGDMGMAEDRRETRQASIW